MKNFTEWIEPYLNDELSDSERTEFEAALAQTPALAEELAQYGAVQNRLEGMRIRQKVATALLHIPPPPSQLWYSNPRNWLLLFFFLLLLLLTGWYFFVRAPEKMQPATPQIPAQDRQQEMPTPPVPPPDTQRRITPPVPPPMAQKKGASTPKSYLALAHTYQQEPAVGFVRSATPNTPLTPLQSALDAYEQKQYKRTVQLLATETQVESDETARFLRASARMRLADWNAAARDFAVLNNSFQYRHEARFNEALCQLNGSKHTEASKTLQEMANNPDFPFHKQAAEILQKL